MFETINNCGTQPLSRPINNPARNTKFFEGMLDMAERQLKDAASEILAMDSMKKDIVYKLGLLYERMNKRAESIACMKEIYEVDYGYQDVARRVESSYSS